jgi:serine protease Do
MEGSRIMKRFLTAVGAFILLSASAISVLAQDRLPPSEIRRIAQSVVMIVALDRSGEPMSSGSGTIVDPAGYIFTNYHVIEGGSDFAILTLRDIAEQPVLTYFAQPVTFAEEFDFAVLQIDRDRDGNRLNPETLNLPYIQLSPQPVDLGEPIHVFGFPGVGDNFLVLTNGTITTIQNGDVGGRRIPVWNQTDAEISPGNSGGLAVNNQGFMVGIPTAVQSEERTGGRLAYLIPLELIYALLELEPPQQGQQPPQLDVTPFPTPQQMPPSGVPGLDYNLTPNYGGISLQAGFTPDPVIVEIISGGDLDVSAFGYGAECRGFATRQPDFSVRWSGRSGGVRFFFLSQGDTVLIINAPNGAWFCSDDSYGTLNPTLDFLNPAEGRYDIWVASYNAGENIRGSLYITERGSVTPANPRG